MSAANKAKGTKWERDIVTWLQEKGFNAKRLERAGVNDIGDVAVTMYQNRNTDHGDTLTLVIEAKDEKKHTWPEYLRQASKEANNYEQRYPKDGWTVPVAMVKRRMNGTPTAFLMFEADEFFDLLLGLGVK
jgi:hypothetical protein